MIPQVRAPKDGVVTKGVVTRRLFSREKFFNALLEMGVPLTGSFNDYTLAGLYEEGLAAGLSKVSLENILEYSAKDQFKDNALWRLLNRKFNVDIAIPFITGYYTTKAIKRNLVTTRGKQIVAERIGGTGSQGAVTAIAIGIGATAAAAGDTALGSESTTNGAARGAATVSNQTTTTTLDTERFTKTFSFTGSFAITEEGLFDNNVSGGTMLARQVFSAVNVVSGDSLAVTHDVKAA